MTTYNQKTIDGESWERARRIVFENPLDSAKSVKFVEERVIRSGGRDIKEPIGLKEFKLTSAEDYEKTFNVIDPTTGVLTGETLSYGDLHQIIFSLYIQLKKEEDGSIAAEETSNGGDPTNTEEA